MADSCGGDEVFVDVPESSLEEALMAAVAAPVGSRHSVCSSSAATANNLGSDAISFNNGKPLYANTRGIGGRPFSDSPPPPSSASSHSGNSSDGVSSVANSLPAPSEFAPWLRQAQPLMPPLPSSAAGGWLLLENGTHLPVMVAFNGTTAAPPSIPPSYAGSVSGSVASSRRRRSTTARTAARSGDASMHYSYFPQEGRQEFSEYSPSSIPSTPSSSARRYHRSIYMERQAQHEHQRSVHQSLPSFQQPIKPVPLPDFGGEITPSHRVISNYGLNQRPLPPPYRQRSLLYRCFQLSLYALIILAALSLKNPSIPRWLSNIILQNTNNMVPRSIMEKLRHFHSAAFPHGIVARAAALRDSFVVSTAALLGAEVRLIKNAAVTVSAQPSLLIESSASSAFPAITASTTARSSAAGMRGLFASAPSATTGAVPVISPLLVKSPSAPSKIASGLSSFISKLANRSLF